MMSRKEKSSFRNRRRKRSRYKKMLWQTMKSTGAYKVLEIYLVYFVVASFVIWKVEPSIPGFFDSLWYCFAVSTTVGFGDFAAQTVIGRVITVILSLYSIGVVAIITAVITQFFINVVKYQADQSAAEFLDDLDHLPELSKEELQDLSERVRSFRKKI